MISVTDVGRGKVVEGGAEFKIKYQAIVYRPFRGEVVDGVVASVNKVSLGAVDPELSAELERIAGADADWHCFHRWASSPTLAHCSALSQHM